MFACAIGFSVGVCAPAAWAVFNKTVSASGSVSTATLAAPTNPAGTVVGSGPSATVNLTWTTTTSSWATGTRVFRGTVSGGPYTQLTQIAGLATTSYLDTPNGGGTFYYVVQAYYSGNGANWTSANSNQVTAVVPYTAYVGNFGSNTLTPINTTTNTAGTTIAVSAPDAIAITPDGTTAYVTNYNSGTVTPITLATKVVGTAITVGTNPDAIAITPDGATAYVANYTSGTVTPITLATKTAGTAITVGTNPAAIAITPDGVTAFVANRGSNTVSPITLATKVVGTAITVGTAPDAIDITPNGATAYVANYTSGTVTPITVATKTAGTAITVGTNPEAVAIR